VICGDLNHVTSLVDLLSRTSYTFCKLVSVYVLKEFLHIMADWIHVFKAILDEHKIAYVSAKGNAIKRATILKSIKDAIVQSDKSKDPSTMLPNKNLYKVISI
jgi:hypothetical protein